MKLLQLFLSSPGDCRDERDAVHEVVRKINADFESVGVQIKIVAWDSGYGVPLEAMASPQASVNSYLPTPEDCEIFIGIFKTRFGSPILDTTLRKENGEMFHSGTEYEFDRAWRARRRGAYYPKIFIYRECSNIKACLSDEEKQQLERLESFFSSPPFKEKATWIGSVNSFEGTSEFVLKITSQLRIIVGEYVANRGLVIKDIVKDKAKSLIADAGPRYTQEIHVDSEINDLFEWLLASNKAIFQLDEKMKNCWEKISNLPDELEKEYKTYLYGIGESLSENKFFGSGFSNEKAMTNKLINMQEVCREQIDKYSKERALEEANKTTINSMYGVISEMEEVLSLLYRFGRPAEKRVLLLVGTAGQGKTHTLVHQVNKLAQEGQLAIGILCQTLSLASNLDTALAQKIAPASTFDEILDALENAAAEKNSRALIAIDALNETPNRKRWRHELLGILQKILKRPHLTATLSVRTDYREDVLPTMPDDTTPWAEVYHPGFRGLEPEALQAYCSFYNVKVPLAPFIGEVSNPLYLQLLIKTLITKKERLHHFPSWLEVWENLIERLENDARGKLDIEPSRKVVIKRILNRIAGTMLDSGIFSITRKEADIIADDIVASKGVIDFLCSSGILMSQLDDNDNDSIQFAFERLTETFLVDCLLTRIFDGSSSKKDKKSLFIEATGQGSLLGFLRDDGNNLNTYALKYGMLKALCLATPKHIGAELPELPWFDDADSLENSRWAYDLSHAFWDSLNWRSTPDEFGCHKKRLLSLCSRVKQLGAYLHRFDRLIQYSMLPDHPVGTAFDLHSRLLKMKSPGERDAVWTTLITELWLQESCTLRSLSEWVLKTDLSGLSIRSALPVARMLGWACAVSQENMRLKCMQALTKILASCPECTPIILDDFLLCNDAYVVEGVLIAVLGKIQFSVDSYAVDSAQYIYDKIFRNETPAWCHITIRHYARCAIEHVLKNNVVEGIEIKNITPPYKSCLPLDDVPDKEALNNLDSSRGYGRILHSALHHDFFWYVMGGTSGGKPFLSTPLPHSREPTRSYDKEDYPSLGGAKKGIFDIPLAARFVVKNCLDLGWTSNRFDSFDERLADHFSRIEGYGRTERIGKKYQWISWHTMLAFLSDNYTMNPHYRDKQIVYNSPEQIGYVKLFDPLTWLTHASYLMPTTAQYFMNIPNLPSWPLPSTSNMKEWARSSSNDLSPSDVIQTCPFLPTMWGEGPWLSLYTENAWRQPAPPGHWRMNEEFFADLWVQIVPRLIYSQDLPVLLEKMKLKRNQKKVQEWGRISMPEKWEGILASWQNLDGIFSQGIAKTHDTDAWLPVPSMSLLGQCGPCGDGEEDSAVLLPLPYLFKKWDLTLDVASCAIRHNDDVVFGLAGLFKKNALYAHIERLTRLLETSGYRLVWLVRGERRAFLDIYSANQKYEDFVWNDYHYILYLGDDGSPNGAFRSCKYLHEEKR